MLRVSRHRPVLVEEEFDLQQCAKDIEVDFQVLDEKIKRNIEEMWKIRLRMKPLAKENHLLEQKISKLDEEIHKLLRNQIKPAELRRRHLRRIDERKISEDSVLKHREAYERLFYILQKNPRYFAALAPLVAPGDMLDFVHTIIFDMYGDQFDTSEERLLLTLFKKIIRAHFKQAAKEDDQGSVFRSNTVGSMMLSAYCRRAEGREALRKVLEQPIEDMMSNPNLNLEINADKVYQEIIKNFERESQMKWPYKDSILKESTSKKYVKAVDIVIKPRREQLKFVARHFLKRIIDNVAEIPYGIRWICKQLAEMGNKWFNKANRYQIGSWIGGYIFLRFFNPFIVDPEGGNLLKGRKLSKIMRGNLILVARVLQNLANGVPFRDKTMEDLNEFLDENREKIQEYFQNLIEIDNFEDHIEVDSYLEDVKRRQPTLVLKHNQIYLIQRLIHSNKDIWAQDQDPLLEFANIIGEPPKRLDRSHNLSVVLKLQQPKFFPANLTFPKHSIVSLNRSLGSLVDDNNLVQEAIEFKKKHSIWSLLHATIHNKMGQTQDLLRKNRTSLGGFLRELLLWAKTNSHHKLAKEISDCVKEMDAIITVKTSEERMLAYNTILMEYAGRMRFLHLCARRTSKKQKSIEEAQKTIAEHNKWLLRKQNDYQDYLGDVCDKMPKDKECCNTPRNSKSHIVEFRHSELKARGIIVDFKALENNKARKLVYVFKKVSKPDEASEFEVIVRYPNFVRNKEFASVRFPYVTLRVMQDNQLEVFKLAEHITLSVKLLRNMLDEEFGSSSSRVALVKSW